MKLLLGLALLCAPIMVHAAAVSPTDKPADKDKKICHSEEVTGSMFPKHTCHTKAEWAAIEEERERSAQQMQDRSRSGTDVPH